MAITVKHSKVSTIPDGTDTSVVRPSDWNADHTLTGTIPVDNGGTGASTLTGYVKGNGTAAMTASATVPSTDITGLGTMSTQNSNNISVTGGSMSGVTISDYVATATKGVANGVASLDGSGTVPISQLPAAVLGALSYQGTWNASTNTPTLTSSVGTKGYYYVVSVAGSTNLNGITDWQVGDWAVYNGTAWQKIDNTDAVTSVNGYTGTVVLTTTDVAEGTNQYFTTARARTSVSAGTGISYDSGTGVITNSSPSLGGDVVGPASATDNAIARFDTTTGKLIQNSIVTVSDTGAISGVIAENFTPVTAPTYLEGKVFYDTDAKTLAYYNDNSQMTVNIGQENIVRVRNQTGADIPDGTVVYINGATGNTPTIAKAIATSFATADIIGVTTTSIANNGFGYATINGLVNGLNTSAFADGDAVFLSATTAGTYTTTEPTRPNYSIQVGVILRANPSVGTLLVSVQIVSTENIHVIGTMAVDQGGTGQTSYTNGQLLIGNTTGNTLTKSTLTAGTGVSVTNGAGSITLANTGVTSAVAGTGISVSGSTGAVTVTNTAPDQTVSIASGTGISATGTYPAFTVTNTAPDQTVVLTAGTGISTSGTYPNFTITNTAPSSGGTVTSVGGTGTVNGITLTGTVTSTGNLTLGGTLSGVSLTTQVSGTLPLANGGTGATTAVAAFNALNPMTTTGDIIYESSPTTAARLPIGTTGQVLTVASGIPAWSAAPSSNITTLGLYENSATIGANYTIGTGNNAMSAGPITISTGFTVTVPTGSTWVIV
jgi:hypothetical protein